MAWLLALFAGMAFAQPSPAGPAVNGSPQVPDAIAQRVQACTPCHSREGRATNEGFFPRIAGKPAGYFYNHWSTSARGAAATRR